MNLSVDLLMVLERRRFCQVWAADAWKARLVRFCHLRRWQKIQEAGELWCTTNMFPTSCRSPVCFYHTVGKYAPSHLQKRAIDASEVASCLILSQWVILYLEDNESWSSLKSAACYLLSWNTAWRLVSSSHSAAFVKMSLQVSLLPPRRFLVPCVSSCKHNSSKTFEIILMKLYESCHVNKPLMFDLHPLRSSRSTWSFIGRKLTKSLLTCGDIWNIVI